MTVNHDLAAMLDQTCVVYRPTESRTAMVTKQNLSANASGLACHIQTLGRNDFSVPYGQQDAGDHCAFFQSTAPVQRGDLIVPETGPWVSQRFWVRGAIDDTDVFGIQHLAMLLEFTDEEVRLPASAVAAASGFDDGFDIGFGD